MDFDLSEEQRLLKESIDGLMRSSYDFDQRKKYAAEKGGWSKFAEQGLLSLPFSEADGRFGAGAVETMVVMEALGKALVLEPYSGDRGARRRLPAPRRLGRAGRRLPTFSACR
jgi:alkylation response protein AidB-like acyl-CoA dehydrogenase